MYSRVMRLGNVLKKWRTMEDRTLREVSAEMRIPLPTLHRAESGKPLDGITLAAIMVWLLGKESK